jgi:hypothetical protein
VERVRSPDPFTVSTRPDGGTTTCPGCAAPVVVRDWYRIDRYELTGSGTCVHCGYQLPGAHAAAGRAGS